MRDKEEDFEDKESQLEVQEFPGGDIEDGEMNVGPPNEDQPPIIFRQSSYERRFLSWVHDLYELTDEPGSVKHSPTNLDPVRPQHEYSMPTFVSELDKEEDEEDLYEADHFQNLPSMKEIYDLKREDKELPEPTHKDIIPSLSASEASDVITTFHYWFSVAKDMGLIAPNEDTEGANWPKETTKPITVSVDQLIASQDMTAGPSRSSGMPIVFPRGGSFVILNGHHRIINGIVNGETQFQVRSLLPFKELQNKKRQQQSLDMTADEHPESIMDNEFEGRNT